MGTIWLYTKMAIIYNKTHIQHLTTLPDQVSKRLILESTGVKAVGMKSPQTRIILCPHKITINTPITKVPLDGGLLLQLLEANFPTTIPNYYGS
jgi:hypothetical protein